MMNPDSFAHARRKSPPKAFSFIAEGGKASQGECDGEWKLPRKLKKVSEYSKANSYMGSELQDPELKSKNGEEMWKHIFRVKASCNAALAKTPSALDSALKDVKPELPPEEPADSESDDEQPAKPATEQGEQPESPEAE